MLLITCPWCGERPELEFRHGGEAHIARPADPSLLSDEEWADFLYKRSNVRGLHAERWRHGPWLRPLLQRHPPHGDR